MRKEHPIPHRIRSCVAVICFAVSLVFAHGLATAEDAAGETATTIPPDQLDALVAPIALYPDDLLAQVLVASTYPLEIMQLEQWLAKNPDLEGDALVEEVAEQPWDASIQSMAAVPEALERLANDIQWTTELGNAFLAQQGDVMDAVQRMRQKAKDNGALESSEQQSVDTVVVEEKTVIVVESADPEIIYVPSYAPTVVYGPPVYPYPPIYYPPYPAGAAFVTFSIGVMWGAAWGGSCCGCGWGSSDIDINIDNDFNRIDRGGRDGGDRGGRGGGDRTWKHDPQHRGGTPYADRATADRFGGSARGDSLASRQASARQQAGRQRGGSRGAAPSAGARDRSAGGRAGGPSTSNVGRGTGAASGAGGDRIGNRSIPSSRGSRSSGAFGGGSSGFSGSSARAHSSRGSSSMGSRGSRGGSRGGGRRR
jgi:hypothetical protein